ncbi:unnamed protein product [Prunus brigantina]
MWKISPSELMEYLSSESVEHLLWKLEEMRGISLAVSKPIDRGNEPMDSLSNWESVSKGKPTNEYEL